MAEVYVKGEHIGYVADYLCECPEDAIWRRDLSCIFWKGFEAGQKADAKEDVEIKEIHEPY